MSLGFLGVTGKHFTDSDSSMGVGKISIELQRMFTFGDALCGALGEYVDKSNHTWPRAWSGTDDKALANFASAAAKAAMGLVTKDNTPSSSSTRADPTCASTLSGSAANARSKKLRACVRLSGVQA